MGMFIVMLCPVGIALALVRRCARAVPAGPAVRGDVPERLLRWAAGLLSAQRAEWGHAMVGELDRIDGRGRRWRFAAGCAGAALLLAPWGRAAAAVWAMAAAAAGAPACTPPWSSGTGWVPAAGCSRWSRWCSWPASPSPRLPAAPPRDRPARAAGRPARRPGLAGAVRVHLLRGHRPDDRAVVPADGGGRGAAAGGGGRHDAGRQRRRRPAHRPAGRPQRRPGPVPVLRPSRSRCSGPAARQGPRAGPSARTSATGSATT